MGAQLGKKRAGFHLEKKGDAARSALARLVDPAMPPILCSRWHPRAHKIWIDNALGAAARCRRVALRQGGIAAFVIVTPSPRVHVQANWISRIEGLGPSRRRRQNRRDRQKRQSLNAHQNSFSDWDQMGYGGSKSIHVRAQHDRPAAIAPSRALLILAARQAGDSARSYPVHA